MLKIGGVDNLTLTNFRLIHRLLSQIERMLRLTGCQR
jgi:hypothetical protein